MELWEALLLGLVEGLTEYLPVSSTGHLVLVERALGIGASEEANAFAIAVQSGAILAVLALYRGRLAQVGRGLFQGDREGRRLGAALVLGFLPAAVIGLLFNDRIEEHLFGLWPIVGAWAVGGVAILAVDRWRAARRTAAAVDGPSPRGGDGVDAIDARRALLIGFAQCLAMWPGTSRSLVTIAAGVLVGLSLSAAVEFSFLLGVITLGAATGYSAVKSGGAMLDAYGPLALGLGFLAALVSALFAVRWMVAWLSTHGMGLFGWYRILLAAGVAGAIGAGLLEGA